MTSISGDRTLLTLSDVRRMEGEARRLREERDKLDAKIRLIDNRLSAARYFMDDSSRHSLENEEISPNAPENQRRTGPSDISDRESLPDGILRTIRASVTPPTKIQIRRALEREPVHAEKFIASPNYFYTAIKRLLDRGVITTKGGHCYIVSEQNETPPENHPDGVSKFTGGASTSPDTSQEAQNANARSVLG